MKKGGNEAAKRFGVEFIYQGPTDVNAPKQLQIFDSLIKQEVEAISLSVLDPESICPAMERAEKQGLIPFTSDSDAPNCDARRVFIQQARDKDLAEAIIDGIAKRLNSDNPSQAEGTIAFVSGNPTATNLNTWMDLMEEYVGASFPNLEIVARRYAGGTSSEAYQTAQDILTAYPDLDAIVGVPSTSIPGVGQAVADSGLSGDGIIYTGYGSPLTAKDYIKSGAMDFSVLWNPKALGYLTVWAGWMMDQGIDFTKFEEKVDLKAPGIESLNEVDVQWLPKNDTILLGPPLVITKDNVDNYNF
ncbi:autoinducer 2 ABC transporter substrate-binding protein [Candidatus Bipolaricaulota bacterium]|nr:autoinducer 2 ABC transporter substrate-binding protein [Candidatus Bipolaricaulota bacterium]